MKDSSSDNIHLVTHYIEDGKKASRHEVRFLEKPSSGNFTVTPCSPRETKKDGESIQRLRTCQKKASSVNKRLRDFQRGQDDPRHNHSTDASAEYQGKTVACQYTESNQIQHNIWAGVYMTKYKTEAKSSVTVRSM